MHPPHNARDEVVMTQCTAFGDHALCVMYMLHRRCNVLCIWYTDGVTPYKMHHTAYSTHTLCIMYHVYGTPYIMYHIAYSILCTSCFMCHVSCAISHMSHPYFYCVTLYTSGARPPGGEIVSQMLVNPGACDMMHVPHVT
jgi:hypothetical protein